MGSSEFVSSLVAGAQQGYSLYGVLPSITIAQAILESGWGTSYCANYDKNLFGIKMSGAKPHGMSIVQGSYATDDGGYYRRYLSWSDSMTDHGFFLANNSRYANIIGNTDYVSVANNLQSDGYATDQGYANALISTIEANNLTKYDIGSYTGRTIDSFGLMSNELAVPETQYGIIPNSTWTSLDVLWGRRYRIIVSSLDGEKALDVSQLRITFNCVKSMQLEPQFSSIVIYNLSPKSENILIEEGFRVTVEAGYEGSQYGLIFDGDVVQAIRGKEDGTTYTLTLVAADADRWMSYSTLNFSMVRGQNSRNVIEGCASKASIPSELGSISDSLSTSKLTRGKVIFGLTRDYIRQIAQSENATAYIDGGKVNIVKADDIPEGEIIDLSAASGLVDIPNQSDYGITIRCLLNPRIKCNMLVHVDNTLVRAQQFEQGQQVYALDPDGIYRVIQITTIGDTRGNDWYTEVETVTQAGKLPAMVANGTQSAW
ncbi:glycoside hydrolase family 73 protein [Desulfosporosinus fructosivorans]|uniref:glycoside hydrolase family 73 protein n=1 Tax=Desulfosporosinus fructosivorans TaxID=2018669 RepID=UPI00130EF081|nr:glucosaminidase domain-containing protein [Desulfosporosinus fructosivorans]